jgi:hypothetical protein
MLVIWRTVALAQERNTPGNLLAPRPPVPASGRYCGTRPSEALPGGIAPVMSAVRWTEIERPGSDPLLPISARYQDGPPLTRGGATRAAVRLGALMSDFRPCSRVWSMSSSLRRVSPSMGPTMAGPYPSSFRWIVLVSISARQLIKRTAVNELLPSLYAPFGRKGLAGALTAEDHDRPRSLHNRVARAIGKSEAQVYRPGARER